MIMRAFSPLSSLTKIKLEQVDLTFSESICWRGLPWTYTIIVLSNRGTCSYGQSGFEKGGWCKGSENIEPPSPQNANYVFDVLIKNIISDIFHVNDTNIWQSPLKWRCLYTTWSYHQWFKLFFATFISDIYCNVHHMNHIKLDCFQSCLACNILHNI